MKKGPLSTIKKIASLFRSLTGLPFNKFTELLQQIEPLYERAEPKRLYRDQREKKRGGGRQNQLDLSTSCSCY